MNQIEQLFIKYNFRPNFDTFFLHRTLSWNAHVNCTALLDICLLSPFYEKYLEIFLNHPHIFNPCTQTIFAEKQGLTRVPKTRPLRKPRSRQSSTLSKTSESQLHPGDSLEYQWPETLRYELSLRHKLSHGIFLEHFHFTLFSK